MTVATAMPDDPLHELLTRLVVVLARAKRAQRKKDKARRRLLSDLEEAQARFDADVRRAIARFGDSR